MNQIVSKGLSFYIYKQQGANPVSRSWGSMSHLSLSWKPVGRRNVSGQGVLILRTYTGHRRVSFLLRAEDLCSSHNHAHWQQTSQSDPVAKLMPQIDIQQTLAWEVQTYG